MFIVEHYVCIGRQIFKKVVGNKFILFMNIQSKTQHPDIHFMVLNLIHKNKEITQRELARKTGISLGSMHYCLRALAYKGWVKAENFKNSSNKSAYLYLLTSVGITQKSKLALGFLKRKKLEYNRLKEEIHNLSRELESDHDAN
ncbi:MarR family EPS-associated transcriptional regulator [Methylophilaceae bacterium]|mgnify:CR=1 FL=1|nr:MarR family EPS-associated transcriptional regulator [Methylophilaceae bacterium]